MTPNAQQLVADLNLLLQKKYGTKIAMAKVMAEKLKKSPDSYYAFFSRRTASSESISNHFLHKFYKVFKADLLAIKREDEALDTNMHSLKKVNEKLRDDLHKSVENNRALVLNNQKLLEVQQELLVRLKILDGQRQ